MAEAFAIVGLVASIAELTRLGRAVLTRVIEYHKSMRDVPRSFQKTQAELPLIIDALDRITHDAQKGGISEVTGLVLGPVLLQCREAILDIQSVLSKVAIDKSQGAWSRSISAMLSLHQEKQMKKALADLRERLAVICFHTAARGRTEANTQQSHTIVIPFARDSKHTERPLLMQRLEESVGTHPMTVLAGLGGVG